MTFGGFTRAEGAGLVIALIGVSGLAGGFLGSSFGLICDGENPQVDGNTTAGEWSFCRDSLRVDWGSQEEGRPDLVGVNQSSADTPAIVANVSDGAAQLGREEIATKVYGSDGKSNETDNATLALFTKAGADGFSKIGTLEVPNGWHQMGLLDLWFPFVGVLLILIGVAVAVIGIVYLFVARLRRPASGTASPSSAAGPLQAGSKARKHVENKRKYDVTVQLPRGRLPETEPSLSYKGKAVLYERDGSYVLETPVPTSNVYKKRYWSADDPGMKIHDVQLKGGLSLNRAQGIEVIITADPLRFKLHLLDSDGSKVQPTEEELRQIRVQYGKRKFQRPDRNALKFEIPPSTATLPYMRRREQEGSLSEMFRVGDRLKVHHLSLPQDTDEHADVYLKRVPRWSLDIRVTDGERPVRVAPDGIGFEIDAAQLEQREGQWLLVETGKPLDQLTEKDVRVGDKRLLVREVQPVAESKDVRISLGLRRHELSVQVEDPGGARLDDIPLKVEAVVWTDQGFQRASFDRTTPLTLAVSPGRYHVELAEGPIQADPVDGEITKDTDITLTARVEEPPAISDPPDPFLPSPLPDGSRPALASVAREALTSYVGEWERAVESPRFYMTAGDDAERLVKGIDDVHQRVGETLEDLFQEMQVQTHLGNRDLPSWDRVFRWERDVLESVIEVGPERLRKEIRAKKDEINGRLSDRVDDLFIRPGIRLLSLADDLLEREELTHLLAADLVVEIVQVFLEDDVLESEWSR